MCSSLELQWQKGHGFLMKSMPAESRNHTNFSIIRNTGYHVTEKPANEVNSIA